MLQRETDRLIAAQLLGQPATDIEGSKRLSIKEEGKAEYEVEMLGSRKLVLWYTIFDQPTLSQIVEAAAIEFPNIPLDKLHLDTCGMEGDTISLGLPE